MSGVSDVERAVKGLLDRLGLRVPLARSSSCLCPDRPTPSHDEGFVVDLLGYEARGTIYLCVDNIIKTAASYGIAVDALAAHVFYHEMCHAILEGAGWHRIPREERPDEAYCEYAALKALTGHFRVGGVSINTKPLPAREARRIAALPRPPPYSDYPSYLLAELTGLDPGTLLKRVSEPYGVEPPPGPGTVRRVVLCTSTQPRP